MVPAGSDATCYPELSGYLLMPCLRYTADGRRCLVESAWGLDGGVQSGRARPGRQLVPVGDC